MIIVEARLESAVSSSRDATLCRVEIVNKTGAGARADYEVRLFSRSNDSSRSSSRLIRTAVLRDWPRNSKPAWRLIQAALEVLG